MHLLFTNVIFLLTNMNYWCIKNSDGSKTKKFILIFNKG